MPALARVAVTVDPPALLEFWDAPRHLMHGRNKFDTTVFGPYWDYSLFMSLFFLEKGDGGAGVYRCPVS